ncbi:MAG: hypothetical protein WCL46_06670 [Chlorobium sp.]|jgi:hypothetical protein
MSVNDVVTWSNSTLGFGFIADVLSVLGAVFAGFAWWQAKRNNNQMRKEKERMNRQVKVILRLAESQRQIILPVHLRRHELTRAELLGRIGMIPRKNKGNFFALSYCHSPSFFQELNRIQASDQEENLIIPCSLEEMEQFDV